MTLSTIQPDARSSALRVAFDARMVHYRKAGIGQYSIQLLAALSRAPEIGPEARIQVLQMRGDNAPIVRDTRFSRVSMWSPPHNRFEQPALGIELLKLRPVPQLIHSPDFVPPRYRRFPAVVNVQDLAFLKYPELTLLTEGSKRYYSQVFHAANDAVALIALSNSARDDIVALLGAEPSRVAVIPAAAGKEFKPATDPRQAQRDAAGEFGLPGPDEGGYVLFVSTLEPRKNIPVLVEAYSLLRDRGIQPLPGLVLAGREGWLVEKVHARIEELKLNRHVKLLGEVPGSKLVGLYQGARAFLMPSLYEGFGLPALEAMACGVPVLASNTGSLPEVVGDAGVLLEPRDPDAWAAALEDLLQDTQQEQALREAGPRRAATFSWPRAASQTWQLYKRVAGE